MMRYARLLIIAFAYFLLVSPAQACGELSTKEKERYVKNELPIAKCTTRKPVKPIPKSKADAASLIQKITPALAVKAQSIVCLGWADLKGSAYSIKLRAGFHNCEKLSHASMPAVFVKWQDGDGIEYVDALIEGNNGFFSIWHVVLNGENFKTINNIALSKDKHQQWLSITIYQTAMPTISNREVKSEPPKLFQPGPPIERRFVYSEQGYQLDTNN